MVAKSAKTTKKTTAKKTASKASAKKSTAKKTTAKKSTVKKTAVKKVEKKKVVAKKATAKNAPAKKAVTKKTAPKKTTASKTAAKKTTPKKTTTKSTTMKKTPAKKSATQKTTPKAAAPKKTVTSSTKKVSSKKAAAPVEKTSAPKETTAPEVTTPAKAAAPKSTTKTAKKSKSSNKPKTSTEESPSNVIDIRKGVKLVRSQVKKPTVASPVKTQQNKLDVPHNPEPNLNVRPSIASTIGVVGIEAYQEQDGEAYMGRNMLAHFSTILNTWKSSLMEEVDRTVHHMQDEAANFPDPNDRATQEEEFSLALRARDRERKLLNKINKAINKIVRDDEFGYCEECGVEIGLRRLEARPTAELCIDCKTLEEIKEKQNGK